MFSKSGKIGAFWEEIWGQLAMKLGKDEDPAKQTGSMSTGGLGWGEFCHGKATPVGSGRCDWAATKDLSLWEVLGT